MTSSPRAPGSAATECRRIGTVAFRIASLDSPIGADGDTSLLSFLPDPHAQKPDALDSPRELSQRLARMLETLNAREREILMLRFGLQDGYIYTLTEIAQRFNLTRERIRQIQVHALNKLKDPALCARWKGFIGICPVTPAQPWPAAPAAAALACPDAPNHPATRPGWPANPRQGWWRRGAPAGPARLRPSRDDRPWGFHPMADAWPTGHSAAAARADTTIPDTVRP